MTSTSTAEPATLPTVGADAPRRLPRHPGIGGVPMRARARLFMGLLFVAPAAMGLWVATRQLAGERVDGANAPPQVMLAVVMLFGGIGVWLVASGVAELAWRRRQPERRARFPYQPWLVDHPWERRGGRDLVPRELTRAIALAGFLAACSAPLLWAGYAGRGDTVARVAGSLLAAGTLVATAHALRRAARQLAWGRSRLRFADFPCAPGGVLEPIFDDLAPCARGLPLRATLRCVQERWETTIDASRERSTRLAYWELWRETVFLPPGARSARFTLPAGAPGTALADQPARWWELELVEVTRAVERGAAPVAEWRARFLVPVYERP